MEKQRPRISAFFNSYRKMTGIVIFLQIIKLRYNITRYGIREHLVIIVKIE